MLEGNLKFYVLTLILFAGVFSLGTKITKVNHPVSSEEKTHLAGSLEKFEFLSNQRSNKCGLQATNLDFYPEDGIIQGSCCAAMEIKQYQKQVEGLKKYSNISQIPEDPYDIPVSLAKELFEYQKNIKLTPEQQSIYDEAIKLSHEGGPCCCRCWRWTAFEGQAKYLITKHNFTADQIAGIWDLEDGCGGGEEHT